MINFNQQSGANIPTIGRRKTEVAEEVVKGINPEADVRLLSDGIGVGNMDTFLDGVNVVVDSLDFWLFQGAVYPLQSCTQAGALGAYRAASIAFNPKDMSFEVYLASNLA